MMSKSVRLAISIERALGKDDSPLAERVFCFYEIPKAPSKGKTKADSMPGSQATLEAYS